MKENKEIIKEWFLSTWGGGLIMPDGWFGRPYDNIHQLDSFSKSDGRYMLRLDGGLLELIFYGDGIIISTSKTELIFSNFDSLDFNWKEYGSLIPHSDKYSDGVVKIVAPPG